MSLLKVHMMWLNTEILLLGRIKPLTRINILSNKTFVRCIPRCRASKSDLDRRRCICKYMMVCRKTTVSNLCRRSTLDAAHILPILFSFTTPAKYCFRAMATFVRYATGMLPPPSSDSLSNIPLTLSPPTSPGLVATEGFSLSPVSSRSIRAGPTST